MPQAPSMGVAAHLGMCTGGSGTATEEYEFLSENLAEAREIIRQEGLRGTRMHPASRVRRGRQTPNGSISLQPTYAELVTLLPRCVAAAVAGSGKNTYTVTDTQPVSFDVQIDRIAKVHTYGSCRCGRVSWRSGPGQPLDMSMDVEALTCTVGNAGTFPSLTISTTPPFVFEDATVTLGGSTYQCMAFECSLDWHLKTDRWVNSLTRTDLPSMDVTVSASFTVPYTSDTTGLYDGGGGVSGVAGIVKFAYLGAGDGASGVSLQFDFANLIFTANKSPTTNGRDEVMMTLASESRYSGSSSPLILTLDSTT